MSLQAWYSALSILGLGVEIALLVVLLARRQYKIFPVFTLYIAFNLFNDIALGVLAGVASHQVVQSVALALLPLQYLIELGVLLEIAWNVLRPVQASLPRGTIKVFIVFIVAAVAGGTLLASHVHPTGNKVYDIKAPMDLTVGLLRISIFALTVGFAHVLGIGWKDKVLQLATALSFYSAADLIVSLGERHNNGGLNALEPLRGVAYLLELGFLVWAFTTKEVRRREFSPQMEQFLVTLAGRAKLARTALVRMQVK
jgi:hypothetical protein